MLDFLENRNSIRFSEQIIFEAIEKSTMILKNFSKSIPILQKIKTDSTKSQKFNLFSAKPFEQ
jgi:hypothetical protein